MPAFLSNIKLKQLEITGLKKSHDLSKTVNILKEHFHCYFPNVFSGLLRTAKFQTGAIADHCFKAIKPPLKDYQYFQNMLSMLLSKCIFKAPVIAS